MDAFDSPSVPLCLGSRHICISGVVVFSHPARGEGQFDSVDRAWPPVAPPATQIYEALVRVASVALGRYCMSETFIIEMRHL